MIKLRHKSMRNIQKIYMLLGAFCQWFDAQMSFRSDGLQKQEKKSFNLNLLLNVSLIRIEKWSAQHHNYEQESE